MDIGAIGSAVITSSIVSTTIVAIGKVLIQRQVDLETATHLETLRAAQAKELAQLKLDYDGRLEQLRSSLAVTGAFEQALMEDRVTLYRSMATALYELKLALDGPVSRRSLDSFSKALGDLDQLMRTNRFFLQRDGVFPSLHSLKHETQRFLVFANGRGRKGDDNAEHEQGMRRDVLDALEKCQSAVAQILAEPSRT